MEMKTLIKKLKMGFLMLGFVVMASCSNVINVVSATGINSIEKTNSSMAITATKYSWGKISKYLNNSSAAEKNNRLSGKKVEKTGRSRKVAMPISIGVAGSVRLV